MKRNKTPRRASQVDKIVGANVRQRRIERGIAQEELARRLGITFQQIQKYENATNRVSCGRLWEIAKILEAPVAAFFGETDAPAIAGDDLTSREALEIARTIGKLPTQQRLKIRQLARVLAQ